MHHNVYCSLTVATEYISVELNKSDSASAQNLARCQPVIIEPNRLASDFKMTLLKLVSLSYNNLHYIPHSHWNVDEAIMEHSV